jgi:flagellar assembly protein FliH
MSSSAPKRQLATEPSLVAYAYAEAESPGGGPGAVTDAADTIHGAEERNRIQRAESFEQGRKSAQQQFGAELDAALGKHRDEIKRALQEFALERQSYYRRVEAEVVQLALAIAGKILHREAQLDPHVLAGIVRVTLEKLDTGTAVHLHVHPREATDWRHYFASQPEGVAPPEVHEDASVATGECRLETSLGSTKVGLASQLKEIETGLVDLLAERPGTDADENQKATDSKPDAAAAAADASSDRMEKV